MIAPKWLAVLIILYGCFFVARAGMTAYSAITVGVLVILAGVGLLQRWRWGFGLWVVASIGLIIARILLVVINPPEWLVLVATVAGVGGSYAFMRRVSDNGAP